MSLLELETEKTNLFQSYRTNRVKAEIEHSK